jgi:hypothetical protein
MRTMLILLTTAAYAVAQPPKSDAPTIGNTVGPNQFLRGAKAADSDAPLLKSLTAEQRAEHDKKFPRGLKGRTPAAKMQAIPKFQAYVSAENQKAYVPAAKHYWGNNLYGDCVPVSYIASLAAWTTFCGQPVIATDAEAIAFARQHGWLNGTWATDVLDVVQTQGVPIGGKTYKCGPYSAVDYSNNSALQAATSIGPLMIAIDANALPSSAGNKDGWYVTGNTHDQNTDHEVTILGFGPAKWLYEQISAPLPAALSPDKQGFLVFTWSTIGFVDHDWVKGTVVECFLPNPTTIGFSPNPQPTTPTAKLTASATTVQPGQAVTLTWTTTNAVAVTLNGGAVDKSGSATIAPAATTTYTLIAYAGESGATATSAVTVTVSNVPPPPPLPNGPFTGSIYYQNGVIVGFGPLPGPTPPPKDEGAALISKVTLCPAVKAALIQLAFAYLMNNPDAIKAAEAALIAAFVQCQTPAQSTGVGSSNAGDFVAGDCGAVPQSPPQQRQYRFAPFGGRFRR